MSYQKLTPIIAKATTEPRYLEDRFSDVINVKDFGAKGNGSSDDTVAIQAAMNAGANTGKDVVFPQGKYNITRVMTEQAGHPVNVKANGHVEIFSTASTHESLYQDYVFGFTGTQKIAQRSYNYAINQGQYVIPKDGMDVSAGDLIILRSNRLVQGESRSSWTIGGVYKVKRTDTNYIYLESPTHTWYSKPTTFDITVTQKIDKEFCKFDNLDTEHFEALYKVIAKTGSNAGASIPFRWMTDWNNTTKLARFRTSGSATVASNGSSLWVYAPEVGNVFTVEKTLTIEVYTPIEVHIFGDFHITRSPVYDGSDAYFSGFQLQYSVDSTVEGITVSNFVYANIRAHESYRPIFRKCISKYCNSASTGYGYTTSGCFEFKIVDCRAVGCRSGYSCGNAGVQDCFGVIENFSVDGSGWFKSSDGDVLSAPYGAGYGGHGNAFRLLYKNCVSYDLQMVGSFRDYKSIYDGCVCYGDTSYFSYAQRFCGLTIVNCRMYAYNNSNTSTIFVRMHDIYDDTEPVVVENCYAEGLRNAFFYTENGDIAYNNIHLKNNTAVFSKIDGILTGVGGQSSAHVLGWGCEIMDNDVTYPSDVVQARRGFFLPRFWIQVTDNVPVRIGLNKWYVKITANSDVEIIMRDTSSSMFEVSVLGGYQTNIKAQGMLMMRSEDEEWSSGDFSPLRFANKTDLVNAIGPDTPVTNGKFNIGITGEKLKLYNRTEYSAYYVVDIRGLTY